MRNLPFASIESSELVVFGLFTMAMLTIWAQWKLFNHKYAYAAIIFFLLALALAILFGYVDYMAIPAILVFAGGFVLLRQKKSMPKCLGATLVALLSAGFMLHKIPGFHNPFIIKNVLISGDGIPYSLYLNFDKGLIGFFFLLLGTTVIQSMREFIFSVKNCLLAVLLIAAFVMPASIAMGYVRVELKLGGLFLQWAWVNLFFTCFAEESFFRGFIQNGLSNILIRYRYGSIFALFIASLSFGIAHIAGGLKYVVLATIAGLGYGWVYRRTQHIEASVLTHFSINAIHFLFFTYPALSGSVA